MRVCRKCKKEKELKSFVANKNCKFGREWTCNTCKNKSNKSRQKGSDYYQRRIDRNSRKLWKLKELGCSLCPEKTPECIDFHHIDSDTKEGNVARMSGVKMFREILKCARVCANCHRKIHTGRIDTELPLISLDEIERTLNVVLHPN